MASTTNGTTATDGMSAAEKLMQQHHKVIVEDVPDEDLPTASSTTATTGGASGPDLNGNGAGSKAAGKQPARDAPAPASNRPALDTQSEELFPSLGASKAPSAGTSMWSKKPAAVGKANGNINGSGAGRPANAASRSAIPGAGSGGSGFVNIPGRYSESFLLPSSQMKPRKDMKKPVADVLRDINRRSKATVSMKPGANGGIVFEGTGPTEAVRSALKEVAGELYAKVSTTKFRLQLYVLIPSRQLRTCLCQ